MNGIKRLLHVDNHVPFREALAKVLEGSPCVRTMAETGSVAEALSVRESFDTVLIGLPLTDDNGPKLVRELLSRHGGSLSLTVMVDEVGNNASCLAFEAGTRQVLARTTPLDLLVSHLGAPEGGGIIIDRETSLALLGRALDIRTFEFQQAQLRARLTAREIQILAELAEGRSDRDIADRLAISVDTVRTHFVHILEKLGVRTRIQALVVTLKYGLLPVAKPPFGL